MGSGAGTAGPRGAITYTPRVGGLPDGPLGTVLFECTECGALVDVLGINAHSRAHRDAA